MNSPTDAWLVVHFAYQAGALLSEVDLWFVTDLMASS